MQDSTITNETKSTHECPVFMFDFSKVEKHFNADKLGVTKIGDTEYSYVLNLDDWRSYDQGKVFWTPPESLVPVDRPEFSFLAADARYHEDSSTGSVTTKGLPKYARIKAKKLRGIVSYGLLSKYTGEAPIGTNVADEIGVKHYDAEVADMAGGKGFRMSGDVAPSPVGVYPKFDIDNFLRYSKQLFVEGEPVSLSEKIHGCCGTFMFKDGEMHCRSRTEWKKEYSTPPKITLEELTEKIGDAVKAQEVYEKAVVNHKPSKSLWWVALESTPGLREFCEANPGYAVYGEVAGQVQKGFNYGIPNGQVRFFAFDILTPDCRWLSAYDFWHMCDKYNLDRVPIVAENIPFNFDQIIAAASGKSLLGSHIREGVVCRCIKERWDSRLGRVCLKVINPDYLAK